MSLSAPILTAEAARILGVTPATVRAMERRGALRATRTGTVRLFERDEVERVALERILKQPVEQFTGGRTR